MNPQPTTRAPGAPPAGGEVLAQAGELDRQGRHEEAVEILRREARSGDAAAMCQLGLRLLIGRNAPQSPQEATILLGEAAERGDADATAQMATLAASGAWMPQDWPAALRHLQLAAERGSANARGQLLLLAGDRTLVQQTRDAAVPPPGCWQGLRESIDIEAWRQPPPRRSLCEAPRIRFAEAFTSAEVCDWLVQRSLGKFKPALMFDGNRPAFSASRNNSDFCFDIIDADLVLVLVRERTSALVKLPIFAMEPPQIFHYAVGQEIKPHYDHVRAEGGYEAERIATLLLYLNDDYEGGELEFCKVGLRTRGRKGDAVYFANVDAAGAPDKQSLHAALPVTRGEKFIFSQWIQDRTFGSAG
ncbi:2OG-Fe(II) oxygenase [Nevskia soli]|uniref:2OG-Fe(II) oxygenase n=1 Tax=Nevskia soli TaxID=418856 RepID=UPI0004A6B4C8|nr:2OG-Fe(II) oxygenase [Nevskia soli]